MTKIIAAVLAIAFGAAQAMPILPHSAEKTASSATAQQALTQSRPGTTEVDEDEAAPPVHIHHTHGVNKKAARKPAAKKADQPAHPKRYSLLLPD